MMKLSISALFVKMTTIDYLIPHLTLGGTLSCPMGGARWGDLVIIFKLIFLCESLIFLFLLVIVKERKTDYFRDKNS